MNGGWKKATVFQHKHFFFFCFFAKYVFPGYEIVIENPHTVYKIGQRTILSCGYSRPVNTEWNMLTTTHGKLSKWWCFLVAIYFHAILACCSVGQYNRGICNCTERIRNICKWGLSLIMWQCYMRSEYVCVCVIV